jgi:hypothetical protein
MMGTIVPINMNKFKELSISEMTELDGGIVPTLSMYYLGVTVGNILPLYH